MRFKKEDELATSVARPNAVAPNSLHVSEELEEDLTREMVSSSKKCNTRRRAPSRCSGLEQDRRLNGMITRFGVNDDKRNLIMKYLVFTGTLERRDAGR